MNSNNRKWTKYTNITEKDVICTKCGEEIHIYHSANYHDGTGRAYAECPSCGKIQNIDWTAKPEVKESEKDFSIDIELEVVTLKVRATNKTEARKMALEKLQKMNPANLIKRSWPDNKRCISIDEI